MSNDDRTWIVVPAYNEAEVIGDVIRQLVVANWRVMVVDDGSSDQTGALSKSAGAIVLTHVINRGQGAALQTGIEYAVAHGASRVVTFDADGQHDPADIHALLVALDGGADIVLGSRFLGKTIGVSGIRKLFLRASVVVSNLLSGLQLSDAHCGLRAFRAEVSPLLEITNDGMAHASELLRKIRKHRLRVAEVPITVKYSEYSRKKGQHGINAVRILFDYLVHGAARR